MSRRGGGSKILTGIICFILGFVMAFASIAGVVCVGLFADVDTIFDLVGVSNTDDNGDNIYINTDTDNGGVSSVYELLTKLVSYAGDYQNLTLGELENLIPATSTITDSIVSLVVEYLDVDEDELRTGLTTTKVSNLGTYVQDLVNSIQVATLIEKYADGLLGDDAAGVIIKAVVYGKEADYVTYKGDELPVYYDLYKLESGVYTRYITNVDGDYVADTSAQITASGSGAVTASMLLSTSLSSDSLESYLVDGDDGYYYLYYFVSGSTAYAVDCSSGDYEYTTVEYTSYDADVATLTGNYYYDVDTMVVATYVTIADLSNSEALTESLSYVSITDLISSDGTDAISTILGDYTIGDLLEGNIDFDTIELAALLSASPSNTAMAVILYDGISAITQDSHGNWTCTYTDDEGNVYDCEINLDSDGNISSITYTVGSTEYEVPPTTVGGISTLIDDLELVSIMDAVAPDDALMMYIFYGVTGVTQDDQGNWTGKYNDETVTILTSGSGDDEVVTAVYYTDGEGNRVSTATTINGVNDVISNIQTEFEIAALMGDVEVDDAIMVYLTYQVTGVYQDDNGDWHGTRTETVSGADVQVDVDIAVKEGTESGVYYVTGVTYAANSYGFTEGSAVAGTTIDGISDVISGMQEELEISSLLGDVEVDDAIMIYLTYKVTGVYSVTENEVTTWYGEVEGAKVVIAVDEQNYVTGVTYADGSGAVTGTTINGISDVISDMQEELEIASLLGDVEVDDAIMIYLTYKVTGVYQDSSDNWHGYVTDDNGNKVEVDIAVEDGTDSEGNAVQYVTGVTYTDGTAVAGTTINGISDVISDMQEELEISSLLGDVEVDDAIMVYLTYKVTGVYQDNNGGWHGYVTDDNGEKVEVDIAVEDGTNDEGDAVQYVTGVTYTNGGAAVAGTTINGISDVISDMQDELELASLLGDITTDDDILIYIAYSVTDVYTDGTTWYGTHHDHSSGTDVTSKVILTVDADGYITAVKYEDDTAVTGTTINGINDAITYLEEDMTLVTFLDDITTDDDILIYIAYSVTGVYYDSTDNVWYGTYNYRDDAGNKTEYPVILDVTAETDTSSNTTTYYINSVKYKGSGETVKGTSINGINNVIKYLQDDMSLAAFIDDITTEDDILIYVVYSVTGVYQDDSGVWYGTYHDHSTDPETTSTVILTVDAEGNITGVTDKNSGNAISGTSISGINDVIKYLQTDMELVTFLGDVDVTDAIMVYVAYKVTGVYQDNNGEWHGYVNNDLVDIAVKDGTNSDGNAVQYVTGVTYADGGTVTGTTIDSVGDVISDMQDELELASLLGDISTDDDILIYIAWSVTGVYENNGTYYGTYNDPDSDATYTVILATDEQEVEGKTVYYITGVTDENGDAVKGTTINGINNVISNLEDDMELVTFLGDVDVTDAIMVYVAYKVTGVTGSNGVYTGTYTDGDGNEISVNITAAQIYYSTDNDDTYYITSVTYAANSYGYEEGATLTGTTIGGVGDVISGIQDELELASLLGDISTDDDILIYIAWSVTGVYYDSTDEVWYGTYHDHSGTTDATSTVILTVDGSGNITAVADKDSNTAVKGTTISEISDVIEYLQDDMSLVSFLDVTTDDDILIYVVYSVTGVYYDSTEKVWYGTYHDHDNDTTSTVILTVDADGKITAVTDKVSGETISGTTISGISSVINYLDDDMELVTFIGDIDVTDAIMVYMAYKVTGVTKVSDGVYTGTYQDGSTNGISVNITAAKTVTGDDTYYITSVTYAEATGSYAVGATLTGTTIGGVSDVISGIMSDLTLGELIDVTGNSFLSHLSGATIDSLSTAIDNLAIQEVFASDIYTDTVYTALISESDFDSSTTYYTRSGDEGSYVYTSIGTFSSYSDLTSNYGSVTVYSASTEARDIMTVVSADATTVNSGEIKFNTKYLYYYKDENGDYKLVGNTGKLSSFDTSTTYYTYGEVSGTWKLLLYTDGSEQAYSVNNITALMTNVTNNLSTATLSELKAMGVISTADDTLSKSVTYNGGTTTLGALTISQVIEVVSALLGN